MGPIAAQCARLTRQPEVIRKSHLTEPCPFARRLLKGRANRMNGADRACILIPDPRADRGCSMAAGFQAFEFGEQGPNHAGFGLAVLVQQQRVGDNRLRSGSRCPD